MKGSRGRARFLMIGAIMGVWGAGSMALAQPVRVVSADQEHVALSEILHRDGDMLLVRDQEAKDQDFRNLYVVRTPLWFAVPQSVERYGEVVDFAPGRFAVMRLKGAQVARLSEALHHMGMACGVLMKLNGDAMLPEANQAPEPVIGISERDERVVAAAAKVSAENIRATVEELSSLETRHHKSDIGQAVAGLLADKYRALAGGRNDVEVGTYDHGNATPQPSLVVRIKGQTRPDEVIVLGSHIDSIAWFGGRAPGADDNASGTATNLEIFRVLMEQGVTLDRTMEIHGYAAEEVGLVGSQDMAKDYREKGVHVVSMVQHDMNIYKKSGKEDQIWFVTSNTNSEFNDQLGALVDQYVGFPWGKKALTMGSSDHASWHRQGFVAAFPFEDPSSYNRQIHTHNDTIANSAAFSQAAGFARLGVAYAMHFGGVR